jgi:hypothetical protein
MKYYLWMKIKDNLINDCYKRTNIIRKYKLFRYPFMEDRLQIEWTHEIKIKHVLL